MNPLGAHIDHQGGSVLARTIDQYTILAFFPLSSSRIVLHADIGSAEDKAALVTEAVQRTDPASIAVVMRRRPTSLHVEASEDSMGRADAQITGLDAEGKEKPWQEEPGRGLEMITRSSASLMECKRTSCYERAQGHCGCLILLCWSLVNFQASWRSCYSRAPPIYTFES